MTWKLENLPLVCQLFVIQISGGLSLQFMNIYFLTYFTQHLHYVYKSRLTIKQRFILNFNIPIIISMLRIYKHIKLRFLINLSGKQKHI